MTHNEIYKTIGERLLQYAVSMGGGLLLAIETSIPYFIPCFIAVILDIISAYCLHRRLHRKYPDRTEGKFRSSYKFKVMYTMLIILLLIIVAHYVDMAIIKNSDISVRFVIGVFLFYECWSILENWSSENDNKLAKALQRIMVNKAERHLNIPLRDILLDDKANDTNNNNDID